MKLTAEEILVELNRLKVNGYVPTDWERRCAAIEAAKAALSKRVPRKVVKATSIAYGTWFECSCCEAVVDRDDVPDQFCANCGQALDWGDLYGG